MGAIMIGIGVTIVSYSACTFLKPALDYDDSLDVFGVHALGGAWGALASGIFAVTLGSGIESNAQQIMVQLKGIAFTIVFAPLATVAILSVLSLVFGSLRVDEEDEIEGLDLSQHSERAYTDVGGGGVLVDHGAFKSSSHAMMATTLEDSRAR
jgi:Amt family ammonium transporter